MDYLNMLNNIKRRLATQEQKDLDNLQRKSIFFKENEEKKSKLKVVKQDTTPEHP